MKKENEIKLQTPSQTIGPYFAYGLTPKQYGYDFKKWVDHKMVDRRTNPNTITITGRIFDGEGVAVNDAMVELWQNDGEQKLFGRFGTGTEADNSFSFDTVKPKSVDGEAPFINVILFMRGQLLHSYTRIYFSDEENLNTTDSLLTSMSGERRSTLVAQKIGDGVYEFNMYMQGAKETVFLEI